MHRRKCRYCSDLFTPDSRVGSKQRVCRNPGCQAKRKKESQKRWSEKNPDYWRIDQVKDEGIQSVRKERAAYMRAYRRKHAEYVRRDNERRNRARNREKPTEEAPRRKQDERFVQRAEIKRLIVELIPCRNQDVICVQGEVNNRVKRDLPAP